MLVITSASAQYILVNDSFTPHDLVNTILVNNTCVSVSNVTVSGLSDDFSGEQSYGSFNANGGSFPFQDGIILSTGRAVLAQGPNTSLLDDGNLPGWGGDNDLEAALGINNSVNATLLEFDFIPIANTISFEYMLSSEEYHDNAPCRYSDGFAFLLKEAGTNNPYTNLAVIPGTDIPVKVTSVHPLIGGNNGCPAQNEAYFDAFNGTQHPTNFNGQTKVLTAFSYVTPGTQYHIKLVIADEGNYRYDSAIFLGGGSFTAKVDLGPDRVFANNSPLCSGEAYPLDATVPGATGYQWYKNGSALTGETTAAYTATSAGDYSVTVQFTAGCTAEGDVTLEYDAPLNFGSFTLLQCDEDGDGLTQYNLALAGVLAQNGNANLQATAYYLSPADAANDVPIPNADNFANTTPNQPIYVKLENQYRCSGIATVVISTSANTVTSPAPFEVCDTDGSDDGLFTFSITPLDAEITSGLPTGLQIKYYTTYQDALLYDNPVTNPAAFTNTIPYSQTIYARINQGGDCYGIAEVPLVIHSFGDAQNDETVYLCEGSPLTLDAGDYKSYTWATVPVQTTREVVVNDVGAYSVTVTNNFDCTGTKTFNVVLSGPVTALSVETADFKNGQNTITAIASGAGNFEYSLDGINFQGSPVFEHLEAGAYTVYARDSNGCGNTVTKKAYVLDYPKYFTPNGDAWHETWRIPYLGNRQGVSVVVYDRFGKLITAFRGNSPGWDGTLDGNKLPATDYWFIITLEDGSEVKGHFALIR
ncbi:choice-of-anchor L domain-containing protein [Flavobacterium sp. RHBU_24]|uniref:choice-of-anchor L domain-containing protein n=1 Tax=Flavobacterium sp. RHBU_24 TaxID=3391185 RepID=UPI003984986E